jgi:hypothetical protein
MPVARTADIRPGHKAEQEFRERFAMLVVMTMVAGLGVVRMRVRSFAWLV